jgi:predicted HicB family RNase H-like nuclease
MAERKQRTTTAIRFPEPLHEQLSEAAKERDLSMNFLVVKACQEFVERLLPPDEIRFTRSA